MISPATGIANRFHPYSRCWMSRRVKWRIASSYPPRHNDAMTHRYLRKMESSPFINHLVDGTLPLIWAKTRLLSDDPAKGEGKAKRHSLLPQRLFDIMGSPSERIDIISSYFVPTRAGVAQLLRMVRKGVKIAILTNSLAANDVAVVHAGYARWRKNCSAMAWNYMNSSRRVNKVVRYTIAA